MERKYDINLRELNDHGIQFKTYEEAKLFSEILEKELKDRIRSEIHKDLNWKKRDEFDKCAMVDEECGAYGIHDELHNLVQALIIHLRILTCILTTIIVKI